MKKFFSEFKKFITRGNVLDMAVGVIVGGAFTAIVTSLTTNFLNPLLNVIFNADHTPGTLADSDLPWTAAGAASNFVTAIVTFLITAFVLFCIVKGINKLSAVNKKEEAPAAPTTKKCPYCLSEIPIEATRCAHCTSELPKE